MTDRIKVWPKPGLTVRDEHTGEPIKPGEEVSLTRLTLRRIKGGDLLEEPPTEREGDDDPRRQPRTPEGTHVERFREGEG